MFLIELKYLNLPEYPCQDILEYPVPDIPRYDMNPQDMGVLG